jgi:hypothetical protein
MMRSGVKCGTGVIVSVLTADHEVLFRLCLLFLVGQEVSLNLLLLAPLVIVLTIGGSSNSGKSE